MMAMARAEHSQIPAEKLVELCSRASYTLDGLWFSLVEEKFGLDTALEIDTEVWRRLCLVQARRIQKYFTIDEVSPIRKLIKIIELDPLLVVFKPRAVELSDSRAVLRFTDCPPQKARIRDGRGGFPCKGVGVAFLSSYVEVIDPKIKVTCLSCPPDAHPKQYWCEWQFEL
jgi:hypothetical protein